jgi:tRNA(Ile)-lysidine synthase
MKPFEKKVLKWIETSSLIKEGENKVLLAVSGGPDSTALFHSFLSLRKKLKIEIGVAHFNHKLRKESDADAEFVRKMCKEVRFHYGELKEKRRKGISPEEWARIKRYEFLKNVAEKEGYSLIATAHTLDDQVETVLMRIFRGTGIDGLNGILPRAGNVIRPLLCVWRKDVLKYLKDIKASYRIDETNLDTKIPRNFIRLNVIPEMEKHFPNLKNAIVNLWMSSLGITGMARLVSERILFERNGDYIMDLKFFKDLDIFCRRWLLKIALEKISGEPVSSSRVIDLLLSLFSPGGRMVKLKKNWKAERVGDEIVFTRKELEEEEWEFEIKSEGRYEIKNWVIDVKMAEPPFQIPQDPNTALLDGEEAGFPVVVRNFRKGDRFIPLGMKGEKKVHDLFIDLKIPLQERKRIPIFLSRGKIVWVGGLRIDERAKIKEGTKRAILLSIWKK